MVEDKKLSVTLEDDRIDFETEKLQQAKVMGWKNIHGRVTNLPGKIDLQSAAGKGSSVFIEINLS